MACKATASLIGSNRSLYTLRLRESGHRLRRSGDTRRYRECQLGVDQATFAAIRGLFTVILYLPSVSVMTEENVTSLPVPAVVGIAIKEGRPA